MNGLDVALPDLVNSIVSALFIVLAASVVVGKSLRRPFLESLALGHVFLAVSFGAALYVCRAMGAPLWVFLSIGSGFLLLGVAIARHWIFTVVGQGRKTDLVTGTTVAITAAIILVHRLITPDPQAGYSFFQSWVPLYLDAALQADRFLKPEEMGFGPGYLTNIMIYPIDIQAFAAAVSIVSGLESHAAYLGGSIAAVIGSFAILAFGLRRSPWALFGFACMAILFFRMAPAFKWSMSDNLGDHMMYLSGSAAMYYLVCGQAGRVARLGSFVIVTASVFSRPSGAIYSAVIGLANGLRDLLADADRTKIFAWTIAIMLAGFMAVREIYLVLTTSIFAARPHDIGLDARNWSKNIFGTLHDWGIRPDPGIFPYGVPLFLFTAVAFIIWGVVWRRRLIKRPTILWIVLAPFLILVGPLMTELITGYRRDITGSKIYILANFFLAWFPFWVLSRVKVMCWWPQQLSRLAVIVVICAAISAPVATLIFYDRAWNWYSWAVDTYRVNNTDMQMANAIRESYRNDPEGLQKVVEKPIIYSYYEPGGGLRFFLGGNYFKDYEFWSDEVQSWMDEGVSFDEILARLDWPNIYMSYGLKLNGYGGGMRTDSWQRFENIPTALPTKAYVLKVIKAEPAWFFIVDVPGEN